ncbi:thioredoxin family protein [Pedobacter sp. SAFR-022]|uniref:thioredoxin family protein n=1 Tax=Pedobacter sp. SAFR-022 TaxID=3436861 RepID=UPI003F80BE13
MDFPTYKVFFKAVLDSAKSLPPYNNPDYHNYTKLNWSRQRRWLSVGELDDTLVQHLKQLDKPQQWIVITEPWCGDAAHILPFLYMLSEQNPLIKLDIQLRDSEPFLIEQYLTRNAKSIPKFVIRDGSNKDLLVWGPRPEQCQVLYDRLKAEHASDEEIKLQLQWWYNEDKGQSLQKELFQAMNGKF